MTRVVFLQKQAEEWLGPMYLSAMLKKRGHRCEVLVEDLEGENPVPRALALEPDVVAFSCLTSDIHWALGRAAEVKAASRAVTVFGGTHPTLNPEQTMAHPQVDVVCVGEGEYPLAELADAISRGEDAGGIPNLWVRNGGGITRNGMRDLVRDLDSLPFPDRTLYRRYPFFEKRGKRPLHFGRGCPYDCTYCHNVAKKKLFEGKGPYVRWRSIESVLAEIDDIEEHGYFKVLHFIDDGFGVDREWLTRFLGRLMEKPERHVLQANMRADMVTEELCRVLGEYGAGLLRLRIAVESGDAGYRRMVLKKNLSDEALFKAADLFHRHGIDFITYNMVGLPGETFSQALKTLRLNQRLRPTLAICFIYQPFPGTDLAEEAVARGLISREELSRLGSGEHGGSYDSRSPLRQPETVRMENLQKVFMFAVRHPRFFRLARFLASRESLAPLLRRFYRLYVRILVTRRRFRDRY